MIVPEKCVTFYDKLNTFVTSVISRDVTPKIDTLNTKFDNLNNLIYPVGSIYMSVNDVNPATLFGGTWEKIKDAFLLASGDVYSNGATGGEATHTLTKDEMPSHTHTQNSHNHTQNSHNHTQNAHHHEMTGSKTVSIEPGSYLRIGYVGKEASKNTANTTATNKATTATNKATTATNQNTGGGQAHNNMPPYLAVNVWKRTA